MTLIPNFTFVGARRHGDGQGVEEGGRGGRGGGDRDVVQCSADVLVFLKKGKCGVPGSWQRSAIEFCSSGKRELKEASNRMSDEIVPRLEP